MTDFSAYEILWYFCVYSFLGWCLEVVFCSVNTGHWVNRGFLNGPVCPIYGFGMVIVLLCLTPLKDNLLILFIGSFFLTSILELITGFVLEKAFHAKWWDYTDEPFNIGGYVCLSFSLVWGLAVVGVIRIIHPPIEHLVTLIPARLGPWLTLPMGLLFAADLVLTVITITGLNRDLGELERIGRALHRGSDALTQVVGGTALAADEHMESKRGELEARRDFLRARIAERRYLGAARLMRAFPHMTHLHHAQLLEELKQDLRQRLHGDS